LRTSPSSTGCAHSLNSARSLSSIQSSLEMVGEEMRLQPAAVALGERRGDGERGEEIHGEEELQEQQVAGRLMPAMHGDRPMTFGGGARGDGGDDDDRHDRAELAKPEGGEQHHRQHQEQDRQARGVEDRQRHNRDEAQYGDALADPAARKLREVHRLGQAADHDHGGRDDGEAKRGRAIPVEQRHEERRTERHVQSRSADRRGQQRREETGGGQDQHVAGALERAGDAAQGVDQQDRAARLHHIRDRENHDQRERLAPREAGRQIAEKRAQQDPQPIPAIATLRDQEAHEDAVRRPQGGEPRSLRGDEVARQSREEEQKCADARQAPLPPGDPSPDHGPPWMTHREPHGALCPRGR
jgi:hypothetical protein